MSSCWLPLPMHPYLPLLLGYCSRSSLFSLFSCNSATTLPTHHGVPSSPTKCRRSSAASPPVLTVCSPYLAPSLAQSLPVSSSTFRPSSSPTPSLPSRKHHSHLLGAASLS